MLLPTASMTSTLSVFFNSHGLAWKAYGFEVRAPTGHKSMMLPLISESIVFSMYVPICRSLPRPLVPMSCTPAMSLLKRTQRVQ